VIIVEAVEGSEKESPVTYPRLVQSLEGSIYLAIGKGTGIMLQPGRATYATIGMLVVVGEIENASLTDYTGTITLKNGD